MENILEYKGYFTKVQYSAEDNVLYGQVEGLSDLVTFESSDCSEIEKEFHVAVDDYLAFCEEMGKSPDKSYKGSFNIRISPDMHKRADVMAKKQGITLNQFVCNAITAHLESEKSQTIIYYPFLVQNWGVLNPVADYKNGSKQQINTSEVNVTWQM